jgi:hypothetical protein
MLFSLPLDTLATIYLPTAILSLKSLGSLLNMSLNNIKDLTLPLFAYSKEAIQLIKLIPQKLPSLLEIGFRITKDTFCF